MNGSWTELLLLVAVGAVAEGAALMALLRRPPPQLIARNYRRAEVVSRGGVTFAAPLIIGALTAHLLGLQGEGLFAVTVAAGLFGLLGWLDDARGTTGVRGLKGHVSHLIRHREVTTGLAKAVGGTGVSLWAAYMLGVDGWRLLPAGALIALAANTVNALDVRPGRAAKLFVLLAAALLAFAWRSPVPGPLALMAAMLGAVLALAPADLRERVMLGDTGANPLGAVLGMAMVSVTRWPTWLALAGALLAFTLAADRWSLSAALEHAPVLGWLDRLGRRRAD